MIRTREKTQSPSILLVDDEEFVLKSWVAILAAAGLENTHPCSDSRRVLEEIERLDAELVVLDLVLPHVSGEVLLGEIRTRFPHVPVIVVTGVGDVNLAVECMKRGAFDYLLKPVEIDRFTTGVERALEFRELSNENRVLKSRFLSRELEHPEAFSGIVTQNEKMNSLFLYAEAIARTSQPVLIVGETGVGKELFAAALHRVSGRTGPYVAVNIAGFDESMFSDTLFGHKKGAFTGAIQERKGLIEQADQGTLFLDEIGELDTASQVKLLRLLDVREYFPLGSDSVRRSRARVVLATNRNLAGMVTGGSFRRDLYYRLSTHSIEVPPLRERRDDLPLLVQHFIGTAAEELGKRAPTVPPQLYTLLETYDFPGNVRELGSLVFDAVSRHRTGVLSLTTFRERIGADRARLADRPPGELISFGPALPTLAQVTDHLIEEALRRAQGNQSIAAGLLGLTQQALSKRLSRRKTAG
jgi:DNA-binding NtrC family response regulator